MSRFFAVVVVCLLVANGTRAADWRSPDGMIAVTAPDPTRFNEAETGPDALAVWELPDGSMRLLVGAWSLPPGPRLRQTGLEEGLMKEVSRGLTNGKLVSSSVQVLGGHELFSMTATGERDGVAVSFTQIICQLGNKVYKVAAAGTGKDTRSDPDATQFISSFRILAPAGSAPPNRALPTQGPVTNEAEKAATGISEKMGYIAGVLLFVALIAWLFDWTRRTGKSRRRKKA